MSDYVENLSLNQKTHITWLDSSSGFQGWVHLEDDVNAVVIAIETLGWILKETEHAIVVAQNVSCNTKDGTCPSQYCNTMTIPKCCIVSRVDF